MSASGQESRSVFIAWAGKKSGIVAQALRSWLRCLSPDVEPWVSILDLPPGGRWPVELSTRLQGTRAGILCLTRDNIGSPWLNFEAGALARSVETSLVIPYAIDIDPSAIPNPMGYFQAVSPTPQDTRRMILRLFEILRVNYDEKSNIFEVFWPLLREVISTVTAVDEEMGGSVIDNNPAAADCDLKAIEDASVAQRSTYLKEILISPGMVQRSGTFELDYIICTEAQNFPVWLGAALCIAEGEWFSQPAQDKEVILYPGIRRYRRELSVPDAISVGDYDLNVEVWIGPKSDSGKSYPIQRTRRWPARKVRIEH